MVAEKTHFDLQNTLSYPLTPYPLSIAHCDGSHVKTDKAALAKRLETYQTQHISEEDLPIQFSQVFDGGLVLHTILSQTNIGATYSSIARCILSSVCSGRAKEIHLCFDKYMNNSIKDSERSLRGASETQYTITGPDQTIRQSGKKLLSNTGFKTALSKFLLNEWQNAQYYNILQEKILFVSYGGKCFQYQGNGEQSGSITTTSPSHLQGNHEEADTLIAFHAVNIDGNVIVRASDTDVLVILIGVIRKHRQTMGNIIMDSGIKNNRRYINVTNIADELEDRKTGLSRALLGYHAFTGCDFTSAFFRFVFFKINFPYFIM